MLTEIQILDSSLKNGANFLYRLLIGKKWTTYPSPVKRKKFNWLVLLKITYRCVIHTIPFTKQDLSLCSSDATFIHFLPLSYPQAMSPKKAMSHRSKTNRYLLLQFTYFWDQRLKSLWKSTVIYSKPNRNQWEGKNLNSKGPLHYPNQSATF